MIAASQAITKGEKTSYLNPLNLRRAKIFNAMSYFSLAKVKESSSFKFN